MYKLKIGLAILIALFPISKAPQVPDENPSVTLFKNLENPESSDQAAQQFLKLASRNSEITKYLAAHLPILIDKGPQEPGARPWKNATQLAGQLKIVETIPSLIKWFSVETGGAITLGQWARLEYNPAAKALSQIGDPAVRSLEGVLSNANLDNRKIAVLALKLVGSTK